MVNKLSISLTYDKHYNIKSFIGFNGSSVLDYTLESLENIFLLDLFNRYDEIVVFDAKQFLKLYSYRNIKLQPAKIKKLHSVKLAHHLKDSNNKNIEIDDVFPNIDCNRIKSFIKIYTPERYLDLIPDYIIRNYNVSCAANMFDYKFDIDNVYYYHDLKYSIYALGLCELNGIKCLSESVKNINGFIYPDYEYDSTFTGRLQNKYPINLQNLSKDDTIRKQLVSRYDGGKFLLADWNSIDLRVLFAMANEMIFADDLHAEVAKIVLEKDNITQEDRKLIKEINFSIVYGAGLDSVSKKTGIEKERLIELLKKLFTRFDKLKRFVIETKDFVLNNGYAKSYFGRKRYLYKDDVTKFINSTIQTTSADICLRAIEGIQSEIGDFQFIKLIPYIVYDKLAIDCHPNWIEDGMKVLNKVMSQYAPGQLGAKVNFPIKIEVRETL